MDLKPNGTWKKEKINDNEVYKRAKEFWEKHFKGTSMTFDVYLAQIYEKVNLYNLMTDEDKAKYMQSQMKLLGKAEREIEKAKERKLQE